VIDLQTDVGLFKRGSTDEAPCDTPSRLRPGGGGVFFDSINESEISARLSREHLLFSDVLSEKRMDVTCQRALRATAILNMGSRKPPKPVWRPSQEEARVTDNQSTAAIEAYPTHLIDRRKEPLV
jgi:hypothetical protein